MKVFQFVIGLLLLADCAEAQFRLKLVSVPNSTPQSAKIFAAGNFNNWDPGDTSFYFKRDSQGIYNLEINYPQNIECKFTLGTWGTVEIDPEGHDIPNRTIDTRIDSVFELRIDGWKNTDLGIRNYHVFSEVFPMKKMNSTRKIWIYLPADYSTQLNKRYPVLYMQDGQNLFDQSSSANGEWGVDETLDYLFSKGDQGAIVVGIENAGASRIDEYSPYNNPEYGGGKGDLYLNFIVEELKPIIDQLYRTIPDRNHTGLMGSSMGAYITLCAVKKHPETFSRFGVFSPSLWFSDSIYQFTNVNASKYKSKIYLLSGVLESAGQTEDTYKMRDSLFKAGFDQNDIKCEIKNDGTHSEWFWKREFMDCYRWLFDDIDDAPIESTFDINFEILAKKKALHIKMIGVTGYCTVEIKNKKGILMAKKKIQNEGYIGLQSFPKGIYSLLVKHGHDLVAKEFEKK